MIDKVDSYMLCSELDVSTINEFESTISFGKVLQNKVESTNLTQVSSNYKESNCSTSSVRKISLKQIFSEYLTDPLSTYTLQLRSSVDNDYIAAKRVNQRFGKYTTSIQKQKFQNELQIKNTFIENLNPRPQKIKLTKISSILKIIENMKKQQKINVLDKQIQDTSLNKNQRKCNEIKIQDLQCINFDQRSQEKQQDKQISNLHSQLFLGLQSNISNQSDKIYEKLNFTNKKSQKKAITKQTLSPVSQNPERRILKIKSPNKINIEESQKYKGLIEGLQFSKKLRKKTFHNKKNQDKIVINSFQLNN